MAKRDITILGFCRRHHACEAGRRWALANCETMQDVWDTVNTTSWFFWVAQKALSPEDVARFSIWAARRLNRNKSVLRAIDVAERELRGEIPPWSKKPSFSLLPSKGPESMEWNARQVAMIACRHSSLADIRVISCRACWAKGSHSDEISLQISWLRKNTTPDFSLGAHRKKPAIIPF